MVAVGFVGGVSFGLGSLVSQRTILFQKLMETAFSDPTSSLELLVSCATLNTVMMRHNCNRDELSPLYSIFRALLPAAHSQCTVAVQDAGR